MRRLVREESPHSSRGESVESRPSRLDAGKRDGEYMSEWSCQGVGGRATRTRVLWTSLDARGFVIGLSGK